MVARSDEQHGSDVVVIGAACLDIKVRVRSDLIAGTSTPGDVRISVGGCARNIAENLARLGVSTSLLTTVCEDDFGQAIIHQTEATGVDTDHILVTYARHSSAYVALLNAQGQLLAGMDDTEGLSALTPDYIQDHHDLIADAELVMIDANLPIESAEVLLDICQEAGVPVGLDPVAFGPAQRYRPLIGAFALVTPNAIEAEALTGLPATDVSSAMLAAKQLIMEGVEIAIITMADAGLVFATAEMSGHVPVGKAEVVDTTGASDALTAAVIYGILQDIPIDEAVRLGASAAALTLASTETVRQDMSLEHLYAQLVI